MGKVSRTRLFVARNPVTIVVTTRAGVATQRRWARLGKRLRQYFRKNGALLLMTLPGVFLLFAFSYLPMVGLAIAFKDYLGYKGIWGSDWVGLQNFQFLFGTPDAVHAMVNTLALNAVFIVTTLVAALTIAFMLSEIRDRSKQLTKFYQSTLFFPFFLSWVIIAYLIFALLSDDSGVINQLITHFGGKAISWYETATYWPAILTVINLWKSVGFYVIIYFAGIIAINPEYYEAASVDGVSKLQQIWYITLPLLRPLILVNVLLAVGRIFYADFGLFFQVTRNSPLLYSTTSVIDTYVYRALVTTNDVGLAAAAGFFQAIIGFVLVLAANWLVRRTNPESALF